VFCKDCVRYPWCDLYEMIRRAKRFTGGGIEVTSCVNKCLARTAYCEGCKTQTRQGLQADGSFECIRCGRRAQ
jgi:hypothetical protein